MKVSAPRLVAVLAFAAGVFALAAPAGAGTIAPAKPTVAAASQDVQPAGWRCGPRRHMNRFGRCVRNRR